MPIKCRERRRAVQREWYARRRREWIDANGPCRRCASTIDLEVDHIDPSTKVDHRVWSWSPERRIAELRKCQVLCRHCHQAKTMTENPDQRPPRLYSVRGFQSSGHADYWRRYWQSKALASPKPLPVQSPLATYGEGTSSAISYRRTAYGAPTE